MNDELQKLVLHQSMLNLHVLVSLLKASSPEDAPINQHPENGVISSFYTDSRGKKYKYTYAVEEIVEGKDDSEEPRDS